MATFRGPSPGTGSASSPISENGAGYEWSSMRQTPQPGPPFHQPEPAFKSDLLDELNRTVNHNAIVTDAPKERFRLGYFDVACLVINRIIGTGIFNSPTTVMKGTQSTGGALLLWFFGIFYALAGVHVYVEYGLNVPRYVIEGVEQAVPRSGGDLHYIQFVYRWLYYKKDTVLYSGCLYGISFIIIGNMASNCINFASRVLQGAHPGIEPDNGHVRGVAMAAAAFACIIHAVSRRGGIYLNNLLALIKIGMLLVIVGTTLAVVGGGIKDANGNRVENVFAQNLDPKVAFKAPVDPTAGTILEGTQDGTANGYAAAFLSIIFAYSGFEQNNYVLGEIKNPRRTFPRATTFAVGLVSILYMVVNVCYMAIVPAYEQSTDVIALLFFRKTFDFAGRETADRIFNSFLALASFGNIIVMTYTASRMKQEIAKQGFLPFSKFFGQNIDLSIGRFILFLRKRGWKVPRWLKPEQHQEATPVGALMLHLGSCLLLIFATYGISPKNAYDLLSGLDAYVTNAWFGFFLALGILILRIWGPPATEAAKTKEYLDTHPYGQSPSGYDDPTTAPRQTWRQMTGNSVIAWLSVVCAIIYLVGNAFPMLALWVPATAKFTAGGVDWWIVPGVSFIVLGFASAWWVGFICLAKYRERHQHKNFIYEVRPEFAWADPVGDGRSDGDFEGGERRQRRQRDGGKILVHETVLLSWEGGEMNMFDMRPVGGDGGDMYAHDQGQQQSMFGMSGAGNPGARLHRQSQQPPASPPPPVNEFAGTDFEAFVTPATQNNSRSPSQQWQQSPGSIPPRTDQFAGTEFEEFGPPRSPPPAGGGGANRYESWQ